MAVKTSRTGLSPVSAPSVLTVPESETSFGRIVREAQQAIAQRAYFLCQQRGFVPGNDLYDWFRAESEQFRAVPVEISEDENELQVLVEVPGYSAEDINVHLEPTRLVIRGNTEAEEQKQTGHVSYSEREATEIFRAVQLPVEVDPEKASAMVRDGILEITLPKSQTAKAKRVQVKAA
ncbi:MAG: Hsp20 family protein [Terriglobales bacterium]